MLVMIAWGNAELSPSLGLQSSKQSLVLATIRRKATVLVEYRRDRRDHLFCSDIDVTVAPMHATDRGYAPDDRRE